MTRLDNQTVNNETPMSVQKLTTYKTTSTNIVVNMVNVEVLVIIICCAGSCVHLASVQALVLLNCPTNRHETLDIPD